MRYFKVTDKKRGWISIWETDDEKTKERVIFSNDKDIGDMERMRRVWTPYSPPDLAGDETEEEITRNEAFGEAL